MDLSGVVFPGLDLLGHVNLFYVDDGWLSDGPGKV